MRLIGIETEYGVAAAGSSLPPEVLSELVIRAVVPPYEDELLTDASATIHPDSIASSRMLGNGGRAYVDHAHPEYSSPETASPSALVLYDRAGDELMRDAARTLRERRGLDVRVYRNTTDGKGASYGRHENYLVDRGTPWARLVEVMTGFLVARIPLVGAGRVGLGPRSEHPGYQISQRADFLVTPIGLQTTHDRPILNTRDEPHADARRWRRLHVITGDPAWNQQQTWLTVGSAALVLAATEADAVPAVRWADPVAAQSTFSRDLTLTATAETDSGRRLTCLDALELHLDACRAFCAHGVEPLGSETTRALTAWQDLLDDLRRDPTTPADRLDWVAKQRLLEGLRDRTGAAWDDPRVQAVDLLWADVERSPAHTLAARGSSREFVSADDLGRAMVEPPADTRAWLRGTLLRRFPDEVVTAAWDDLLLRRRGGRLQHLAMPDPWSYGRAECSAVESAPDLESALAALGV